MSDKKEKLKYNLVKLTDTELKEAILNKDKIEIDLLSSEGKLEIQNFKINNNIPQYELNEDIENIEDSLEKIKEHRDKLDKEDSRYDEKLICHKYDLFCGERELELSKLKAKKNMGDRIARDAIDKLKEVIVMHKHNLKVFKDQIRNKVRKERIVPEQIQLNENSEQ